MFKLKSVKLTKYLEFFRVNAIAPLYLKLYLVFTAVYICVQYQFLYYNPKYYSVILINNLYNLNFFSIALFVISIFISFISIIVMDLKILRKQIILLSFFFFNFFLFIMLFTSNFLTYFIMYESLLLISTILVYNTSPNLRSKNIAFYFLLWTQLGSFFVFLALIFILTKSVVYNFDNFFLLNINIYEKLLIATLLFVGFGIKIPIWPFHFWLTKTHVEANTGFSIFLSGILVKTALYGLYKFFFFFDKFNSVFIVIIFISILDASLKIFSQTDLKKIVAYCTIFEMNIILLLLFFLNKSNYVFIVLFSILHTTLSGLFFFIIDCIYKRYNSRTTTSVYGIQHMYPNLSCNIILSVLLFNGLPFTLKFNLELFFLNQLLSQNALLYVFMFFIQIYLIIFFTRSFLTILFSYKKKMILSDLTLREILIFAFLYTPIIIFSLI